MQRGNYPSNPYSSGAPFNIGEKGFKSPTYPPRFQSSPGFRFQQQQFVPHHGPRRNSPNNYHMQSPRRNDSSYGSPQQMGFDSHTPGSHNSNRSFSSGSANSSWSASSERGKVTPRGRYLPSSNNNGSSPRYRMNFSSPRYDPNSNPGGCNDISLYYNQDMIQDPWANMKPIPVSNSSLTKV